jgi:hypothetical protein
LVEKKPMPFGALKQENHDSDYDGLSFVEKKPMPFGALKRDPKGFGNP